MSDLNYFEKGTEVSVRDAFGRILVHAAENRANWVLLDADVAGGTGAKPLVQARPDRIMQFGIAEQNMMAAAAGVADTGLIPVVSTFAAFGTMRAHEQFRTAIAYAKRNVKLCCSHLGIDVGPDGPTAQMLEDLAIMRSIPNVTVLCPADANQFMAAFEAILDHEGPVYMRIGRSPTPVIYEGGEEFIIGKADRLREGKDITLMACGVLVPRALQAADILSHDGINARVVNISSIKPVDGEEIIAAAKETKGIVTAEDHNVLGGMGSAVAEFCAEHAPTRMRFVGVQDRFGKSGEHHNLPQMFGLTAENIAAQARNILGV